VAGTVSYAIPPHALSQAEIDAGYVLMCLARPETDLTLDLHQPLELDELRPRKLPARVVERTMLAHDVIGLKLKLPRNDGERPFRWLAGQYIDFLLADGRRRSFSIANAWAPDAPMELHLRITPGGRFAKYVQEEMPERAILRFEGPLGAFYLREDSDRPVLLMAGGTGFAPIKAIVEHALSRGIPRDFHLFRGVRSRRDLYLDELAQRWAAQHPRFHYTAVLSEPDEDWRGERGFVHEIVLKRYPSLAGREVYMSGPPVMIQAGKRAFGGAGLDADHLFYDSFDYAFETWPSLG
jgi:CDP-4-dehydro-6-deoxyglucose reductase, E3